MLQRLGSGGKLDEDDEEWVEDKRYELEEFLDVVKKLKEVLPEDKLVI